MNVEVWLPSNDSAVRFIRAMWARRDDTPETRLLLRDAIYDLRMMRAVAGRSRWGRHDGMSARRLPFFCDCVGWPRSLLPALERIVEDGREVRAEWFVRNVDLAGSPVADLVADHQRGVHGTAFYRLPGERVFWAVNSLVEYVFAEPETIDRLASG